MKVSTIILFISALLISEMTFAQLTKDELPKDQLVEKTELSPSNIRFKKKYMIAQTDPVLNYGFQYTVWYKMNWIDENHFNLEFIKSTQKNNNILQGKAKTRRNDADFFHYSPIQNWSITLQDDGSFLFENDKPTSRPMVYLIEQNED